MIRLRDRLAGSVWQADLNLDDVIASSHWEPQSELN